MAHFPSGLPLIALGTLAISSAASVYAAAQTPYKAVDVTIKTNQSEGRISASATASPVLGVKNPPVKNGVAYVGMNRVQGTYSAVLSTKLPVNLRLDLQQGELQGSLAGVPLSGFTLKTNQTDVAMVLPAVNLTGVLDTQQGEVNLVVPANVGVQFELQKWNMGSLTINEQKVVDSLSASGSYATPNFDAAKYKLRFTVMSNQTDITVTQK